VRSCPDANGTAPSIKAAAPITPLALFEMAYDMAVLPRPPTIIRTTPNFALMFLDLRHQLTVRRFFRNDSP
jgi:hypothetical protein